MHVLVVLLLLFSSVVGVLSFAVMFTMAPTRKRWIPTVVFFVCMAVLFFSGRYLKSEDEKKTYLAEQQEQAAFNYSAELLESLGAKPTDILLYGDVVLVVREPQFGSRPYEVNIGAHVIQILEVDDEETRAFKENVRVVKAEESPQEYLYLAGKFLVEQASQLAHSEINEVQTTAPK